jgi:hypothetical protein
MIMFTNSALPMRLLHGSSKATIARLSSSFGSEGRPFGPALYLTEDREVARCYVGPQGAIYEVSLQGNDAYTIALNEAWSAQTIQAREAMLKLLRHAAVARSPDDFDDARSLIESADAELGRAARNAFLRDQGIWMIFGHIHPMEHSGLCDRGVQYALIDDASISGVSPMPASSERS